MYSEAHTQHFSEHLLAWYQINKRDLPWRQNRNPYYIWVSEIMLQQTRVDTVIPYFHRFIEKFPTIEALATAKEEDVLKAWEGLGYYSRARNLQRASQEVHEKYQGLVPDKQELISALPGIGPYTSGAILSIAYNQAVPAVDGNVMRVLSRYFLIEEDIMKPSTRHQMEQLAQSLIIEGQAADFNQALMEFGAMICTPRAPYCLICPMMNRCSARQSGLETSLPVKKKSKAPRHEHRIVAWIEGRGEHAGKILFRQRPQEGLLAKMWELPHVEWKEPQWETEEEHRHRLQQLMSEEEKIGMQPISWQLDIEHVFSHIHWEIKVYTCHMTSEWLPYHYRWIAMNEREHFAFPIVFTKIIEDYMNRNRMTT